MYQSKKGIDIIAKVLDALYAHNPDALFVMSLMHQYEERGSLSKKQLEGLLSKARGVENMPQNWIGTLEAIILKMPTRHRTKDEVITASPVFQKQEEAEKMADAVLIKYPQHKRVLFLKAKINNKELLSPEELTELKKFCRVLSI